jgi:hypothetical protein
MNVRKLLILFAHGFVLWMLCGAVMYFGQAVTTLDVTLAIHLVAAPVFAASLTWLYFTRFNQSFTTPLQAALAITGFVFFADLLIVAPLFEKSFAMFESVMGTWLPFLLIFTATYLTGAYLVRSRHAPIAGKGDLTVRTS